MLETNKLEQRPLPIPPTLDEAFKRNLINFEKKTQVETQPTPKLSSWEWENEEIKNLSSLSKLLHGTDNLISRHKNDPPTEFNFSDYSIAQKYSIEENKQKNEERQLIKIEGDIEYEVKKNVIDLFLCYLRESNLSIVPLDQEHLEKPIEINQNLTVNDDVPNFSGEILSNLKEKHQLTSKRSKEIIKCPHKNRKHYAKV